MRFTLDSVLALTLVVVLSVYSLVVGLLRWTGRSTEWANPHRPNIAEIVLVGRSPLTFILMSAVMLSAIAGPLASVLSWTLTLAIFFVVFLPSFALFLVVRFVRPWWSEPPWVATYDWDHHERRRHSRKRRRHHRER